MAGVLLPEFKTIPADYPWFINFEFEKNFDHVATIGWFQKYWTSAFLFSAIYLVLIFGGQRLMQNRARFELYWPLTIWSSLLAIYSWYCSFVSWGELLHMLRNYGWHASACDPICYTSISGFLALTFPISKLFEFGDTAFIVLRKQKLIYLHWYHHITALLYAWFTYGRFPAPARYCVFMNVNVHAVMYAYYAAKASKMFRIPRAFKIFITSFQTTQMFVVICINFYALHVLNSGGTCSTSYFDIYVGFLLYLSYFILFIHFSYKEYFVKKTDKMEKSVAANGHDSNANGHSVINGEAKKQR